MPAGGTGGWVAGGSVTGGWVSGGCVAGGSVTGGWVAGGCVSAGCVGGSVAEGGFGGSVGFTAGSEGVVEGCVGSVASEGTVTCVGGTDSVGFVDSPVGSAGSEDGCVAFCVGSVKVTVVLSVDSDGIWVSVGAAGAQALTNSVTSKTTTSTKYCCFLDFIASSSFL